MSVPTRVRASTWSTSGGVGTDGFYHKTVEGIGPIASKRDNTPRPNAVGSFPTQGYADDRTAVITGSCWASSPEKMTRYGLQLSGLFMDGLGGKVYFERPGLKVWGYGFRTSIEPKFDPVVWGSYNTFQLSLWFPDSRLFGDSHTYPDSGTATSVTAWQYGNYEASPVITVTGAIAGGYAISGPTGTYVVTHALVTGHPHTINMADGSLVIDGARVTGATPTADTWTIKPGQTALQILVPTGAGSGGISVTVPDTYIGVA